MSESLRRAMDVSEKYVNDLIQAAADAENRLAELDTNGIDCSELRARICRIVGHIETARARERFLQEYPEAYD